MMLLIPPSLRSGFDTCSMQCGIQLTMIPRTRGFQNAGLFSVKRFVSIGRTFATGRGGSTWTFNESLERRPLTVASSVSSYVPGAKNVAVVSIASALASATSPGPDDFDHRTLSDAPGLPVLRARP